MKSGRSKKSQITSHDAIHFLSFLQQFKTDKKFKPVKTAPRSSFINSFIKKDFICMKNDGLRESFKTMNFHTEKSEQSYRVIEYNFNLIQSLTLIIKIFPTLSSPL